LSIAARPGKWLAQTAAGSTVGRPSVQLARSEGFRALNLVRRSAQVAEIVALGGDLTLCMEDTDWQAQFVRAAESAPLEKAIDCVGGPVGGAGARTATPRQTPGFRRALLAPAVRSGATVDILGIPVCRDGFCFIGSTSRRSRRLRPPCVASSFVWQPGSYGCTR
jgi:hypothetical protein